MPPPDESRILITQAEPGMVLARAVILPDTRQVLVKEGTELGDALIERIMLRGVKRIWVRGTVGQGQAAEPYAEQLKRLAERFRPVAQVPMMAAIKAVVARVLAKRA